MPDVKDWTWVLERPCPECGFDAASVPPGTIGALVRANAEAWEQVLARPAGELRRRPARAVEERYLEQDPAAVSAQLRGAALELAEVFDGLRGDRWQRPGRRSDGARFDVAGFGRYMIHDPVHHLFDVGGHRGSATPT